MLSKTYCMKTFIKFLLLGALIGTLMGAVVMLVAIYAVEWKMNQHPALDTQVLDYLTELGCPIDTAENNRYVFVSNEDRIVFDYFDDDQGFLRFFAIYDVTNSSYEEVAAAAIETTDTKKNCTVVPKQMDDGDLVIQISVESFIDENEALNTDIIDRSLRVLQGAHLSMIHKLGHL